MKKFKLITTALICGTIALSSCDKQNNDGRFMENKRQLRNSLFRMERQPLNKR